MAYLRKRYKLFDSPYSQYYKNISLTEEDMLLDNYLYELTHKNCLRIINYDSYFDFTYTEICSRVARKAIDVFAWLMQRGFNILDYSENDINDLYNDLCALPNYKHHINIAPIEGEPKLEITKKFLEAYNSICNEYILLSRRSENVWKAVTSRISIFNDRLTNLLINPGVSKEQLSEYIKTNFNIIEDAALKIYDININLK